MNHRLSITRTQAALAGNVLNAAGLMWTSEVDPDDTERIIITEIVELLTPTAPFSLVRIQQDRYVCAEWPCRPGKVDSVIESDSIEAVLTAMRWVLSRRYNEKMARILSASLMLAIRSEAFIAHSDETDSSVDSGDAIDVMYGAVRAIDPTYKKEE